MAYDSGYRRGQAEEEDAEPIKQMAVACITMAEDLRTSIAFGRDDVPMKWREFMRVFSMLHGITKPFVPARDRADVDAFLGKFLMYGYAVQQYKKIQDAIACGEADDSRTQALLKEVQALFETVNPKASLAVLDGYITLLKNRGMYSMKETVIIDEGFEDDDGKDTADADEPGKAEAAG